MVGRRSNHDSFFTNVDTASSICLSDNPVLGINQGHSGRGRTGVWEKPYLLTTGSSPCRILHRIVSIGERARAAGTGSEHGQRSNGATEQRSNGPYLAKILGSVPWASRIRMGMSGLFFFMVG